MFKSIISMVLFFLRYFKLHISTFFNFYLILFSIVLFPRYLFPLSLFFCSFMNNDTYGPCNKKRKLLWLIYESDGKKWNSIHKELRQMDGTVRWLENNWYLLYWKSFGHFYMWMKNCIDKCAPHTHLMWQWMALQWNIGKTVTVCNWSRQLDDKEPSTLHRARCHHSKKRQSVYRRTKCELKID